jgi:hypothetical protein
MTTRIRVKWAWSSHFAFFHSAAAAVSFFLINRRRPIHIYNNVHIFIYSILHSLIHSFYHHLLPSSFIRWLLLLLLWFLSVSVHIDDEGRTNYRRSEYKHHPKIPILDSSDQQQQS